MKDKVKLLKFVRVSYQENLEASSINEFGMLQAHRRRLLEYNIGKPM